MHKPRKEPDTLLHYRFVNLWVYHVYRYPRWCSEYTPGGYHFAYFLTDDGVLQQVPVIDVPVVNWVVTAQPPQPYLELIVTTRVPAFRHS